ncbi:TauD/TfdA family dioxygenase [Kitasatospora xanthocidica]|uniref:TauD/TfdA family dioxygenase n=1 Tax=Kitasatospora xanthocidica TaxID=83382 RepID=UPI0036EF8E53
MTIPDPLGPGVREARLPVGATLPLLVEATDPGLDVVAWATRHREHLRDRTDRHGAVLLRGFAGVTAESFEAVVRRACGDPLEYVERSSPRHAVHGNVYSSTDHPARETIHLHNEQSYNLTWPLRICFCCLVAPGAGGATPLADCRRIHARVPEAVRRRFADRGGYLYVRNFGSGAGLDWQEAFRTDDPAEVDRYCAANGITTEWTGDGGLRTRQRRPAATRHPRTGEWTWFNHITFFHVSTLGPDMAEALVDAYGTENLPNNTYYGDGQEIEPEVLDLLRAAYAAELTEFPWQRGDVLLVDNMLTAHGRAPFEPPREIVVGMADPVTSDPRTAPATHR